MRRQICFFIALTAVAALYRAADSQIATRLHAQANANTIVNPNTYQDLRWRTIGPHRGGRSTAAAGVRPGLARCSTATRSAADELVR